jgi:anti-anti-sigma regulatory factor
MQPAGCMNRFSHTRVRDIDVDASDVNRVGAQCVQVLLSAVQSWHADHQQFQGRTGLRCIHQNAAITGNFG